MEGTGLIRSIYCSLWVCLSVTVLTCACTYSVLVVLYVCRSQFYTCMCVYTERFSVSEFLYIYIYIFFVFIQSKSVSSTDSQPPEERQGPSGGYSSSQGGAEAKRRRCDDKESLPPHSYVSAYTEKLHLLWSKWLKTFLFTI